jgi:hypothetical protein
MMNSKFHELTRRARHARRRSRAFDEVRTQRVSFATFEASNALARRDPRAIVSFIAPPPRPLVAVNT